MKTQEYNLNRSDNLPLVEGRESDEVCNQSKLYNLSTLHLLSHGKKEFVDKMIELFRTSMPAAVETMMACAERMDYRMLKATAHKMKPNIDVMGIDSLREDIRLLEHIDTEKKSQHEIVLIIEKMKGIINLVMIQLASEKKCDQLNGL